MKKKLLAKTQKIHFISQYQASFGKKILSEFGLDQGDEVPFLETPSLSEGRSHATFESSFFKKKDVLEKFYFLTKNSLNANDQVWCDFFFFFLTHFQANNEHLPLELEIAWLYGFMQAEGSFLV